MLRKGYQKSRAIIQRDGWIPYFKRLSSLAIQIASSPGDYVFYRRYLMLERVFQKETEEAEKAEEARSNLHSRIPDCSEEIVSAPEELDRLISSDYDFSTCPYMEYLRTRVNQGDIILLLFIGGEFSSYTCMALNNQDPIFQKKDDRTTGFIGPSYTSPTHRSKGIFTYAMSKACDILRERDKSKALLYVKKKNLPSIKGMRKAGFTPCAEVRYLRLLLWNFPRERELKKGTNDT